ncbi:helix-turn-helix domain-containing protein [Streptomyces echinatus]|uniref:helix-turn-helix domain-containing protein n=1 Tax=Streptomyces echinatus TaxID=67293 RepID=UPI0037B314C1
MPKSTPTTPPLDREAKRRLAVIRHVEEVSGNVAMSCRYFGISRQAYYTWYRRYQTDGVEGLRTRFKAPKTSPNATHVEVVGKIIYLRQNYHFGPEKVAMYLKRYHDVTISKSGVWRILNRLDMGRLPASQRYKRHDRRWKRYEKQLPGHRVQIDVKFIQPLASMPNASCGIRTSSAAYSRRSLLERHPPPPTCPGLRWTNQRCGPKAHRRRTVGCQGD